MRRRVERLWATFQAWLFAPGDPRRLAALRIGLAGLLTVRLATGPYLDLARQPAALFRPISFLKLLPHMPPPGVVIPLQVVGVAAALLATVGLWTRMALPVAYLAALPLIAMTSSLGKTVHNDVLLLLCLFPLLPAPAGDAWSLDAHRRRGRPPAGDDPGWSWQYGWPLRTGMVVIAGAYFFTGYAKLLHAGPAWVTSGNLRWVLYGASDAQAHPNGAALLVADRPWLAHLFAAGTLAVELGFPLVLLRPRLAWLLVPAVAALHTGIWVAMRLDYYPMAATVLIVFVNWPALPPALTRRPPSAPSPGGSRSGPRGRLGGSRSPAPGRAGLR
jgi:hypothetical protein